MFVSVGCSACWTASACFPDFFANDSSDRVRINTVSRLPQVLSEGLIDHRLVPSADGVGSLSERLEHLVVDVNRDARLPPNLDFEAVVKDLRRRGKL